jgi:hypothetical protein
MKRPKKTICPLTLAMRARFIEALGADDVPALQAELRLLEARCARWREQTGSTADLAGTVRAGLERFTRDPEAGRRIVREGMLSILATVLRLRRAADRAARPDRGDPGLRSRDPRVRAKARARIWGR